MPARIIASHFYNRMEFMKHKHLSIIFLTISAFLLTACAEVQTATPNVPAATFDGLTPEYVGRSQFASYVKDIKDLKIGCEGAIYQWQGYAQQAKDNPNVS